MRKMEVNGTTDVNQLLKINMMKNVLQKSLGDGMEFEIVYQSLLNSLENQVKDSDTKNVINALQEENINSTITSGTQVLGAGTNLKDLPIKINNNSLLGISNSLRSGYISDVSTTSNSDTMKKIYEAVNKYSKAYGVDANLVLAVIKQESGFNPNASSSAGAKGLMQLMPACCSENGVTSPYDIDDNIQGGIKQLKWLLNYYGGDTSMALMGYNAGIGTVQNRGVSSASELYKMPKETQNYVPSVLKYYNNFINA